VIKLEEASDEIEEIQNEITFLHLCHHPHVVGYYHSHVKGMKLWMVMELMIGSCQDLVSFPFFFFWIFLSFFFFSFFPKN